MAKYTNLQIVNKALDAIGSDQITSIGDTFESARILTFLELAYFDLINQGNHGHLRKIINLTAATSAYPNYLIIPDAVAEVCWIKYDQRAASGNAPDFTDITYLEPYEFMNLVMGRDDQSSAVDTITDYDGSDLFIFNDEHPQFWTSFDDVNIVFDAYKGSLDSELQSAKSRAEVIQEPTFSTGDSATPDLPSALFPGLVAEVISMTSLNLRQVENGKAEQVSRRQRTQRSRKRSSRTTEPPRRDIQSRRTAK